MLWLRNKQYTVQDNVLVQQETNCFKRTVTLNYIKLACASLGLRMPCARHAHSMRIFRVGTSAYYTSPTPSIWGLKAIFSNVVLAQRLTYP